MKIFRITNLEMDLLIFTTDSLKVVTVVLSALFLALLSLAWATSFIVFVILATALTDVTRRSTKL